LFEIKDYLANKYEDSALFYQNSVDGEPALYSACQRGNSALSIGKVTFFDHYGNSFIAENNVEVYTDHYDEVHRILLKKYDGQSARLKDRLINSTGIAPYQRRIARIAMTSFYIESIFRLLDQGRVVK
jgi:hypothetical protein